MPAVISTVRRLIIAHVLPRSWSWSQERMARSLLRFSVIEADSAWQFLNALNSIEDPRQRSKVFLNALEEVHHAALFADLAQKKSAHPLVAPPETRRSLLEGPEKLGEFLAYIEVGEHEIYDEFETYAQVGDADASALFLAIREDEEGHHEDAGALLEELSGGPDAAARCMRRAKLKKLWHNWLRFSEVVGELFNGLWMRVVYVLIGPLFTWVCRSRMKRR